MSVLASTISFVFPVIFPRSPDWIATVFIKAVPATVDAVRELREHKDLGNAEKKLAIIETVREYLDENLDDIAGWRDLGEAKRDSLIDAMTELVYFVVKTEGAKPEAPKQPLLDLVKLLTKARRKSRS